MPGEGECFLLPHVNNGLRWIFPQITSHGGIQEFDAAKKGPSERRGVFSESIEWFIEDLAFSLSNDLALPPFPTPLSRQQVVSGRAYLQKKWVDGLGWGPYYMTARKPGPLWIIQSLYFAQSTFSDTVKVLIMFSLLNTIFKFLFASLKLLTNFENAYWNPLHNVLLCDWSMLYSADHWLAAGKLRKN